jgi:hypothetical protein
MLASPIALIEFNRTFCARKFDGWGWLGVALLESLREWSSPELRSSSSRSFRGGIRNGSRLGGGRFCCGKALASHCVSPCAQTIGCGQLQNSCEVSSGTPEIATAFLDESPLRQRGSKIRLSFIKAPQDPGTPSLASFRFYTTGGADCRDQFFRMNRIAVRCGGASGPDLSPRAMGWRTEHPC